MTIWNSIISLFRFNRGNSGTYKFSKIERKLGRDVEEQSKPKEQQETPPMSPNRESGIFEEFTMGNSVVSDTRIHPTRSYFRNKYMKSTYGSDSALSVAISDEDLLSTVECPRCRSCVLDSRFDIFGEVRLLDETADSSDYGYDSMDNSTTSIVSLVRASSIQDKSLKLMRKRHQKVAKRRHVRTNSDGSANVFEKKERREAPLDFKITSIQEERKVHFDENEIKENRPSSKKIQNKMLGKEKTSNSISRSSSIQMKSWQIRRQRKDLSTKRKKAARLSQISLGNEDRLI